ncbi:MAG: high frequency lysogenization protein HflD [Idiomarina sp.]
MNEWQQRTLALAGLAQAVAAVQQLAREGSLRDNESADILYESVLAMAAPSTEAVYGSRTKVAWGLRVLLEQIGASTNKSTEITRYMVSILALARRYEARPEAVTKLADRLQQIQRQRDTFAFDNDTIVGSMAGAYSDIISPLSKPIRISGNPDHLQRRHVQNQIRALLLAAIRSACLWRAVGGKRRHFLLSRKSMVDATKQLLMAPAASSET